MIKKHEAFANSYQIARPGNLPSKDKGIKIKGEGEEGERAGPIKIADLITALCN